MLGHELAGLHATEQLVGVAAHVARGHFVRDDLAVGVHDEASSLGQAVLFDKHLEVARQSMRRVGQHGVLDLLNALGSVVPRLMHEMGVRGNGVDLAPGGLELVVLVGQVLKLGGTHEREVGRVEEEHAPLAQDVVLGHRLEFAILKRLHAEISYLFVDHRHAELLSTNDIDY